MKLTHSDSRYITIVIDQTPLVTDHVKLQHMVVDLVRVLIESTECVNLIIPAICHRGIDQAGRPLTQSSGDLWTIPIHAESSLDRRIRHQKGIIRRCSRIWSECGSQ